jgi:hypothetical protein
MTERETRIPLPRIHSNSFGGFNNDITANGVTYHVLTEDLGARHAMVVTQIFSNGRVVATHKTSYPVVADARALDVSIRDLMRAQHRRALVSVMNGAREKTTAEVPQAPAKSVVVPEERTPTLGVPSLGALESARMVSASDSAILEIVSGERSGEQLGLYCAPIALGRLAPPAVDVLFSDAPICVFVAGEGEWRVVPKSTALSIAVNGAPATNEALQHGDVIDAAGVQMRFLRAHLRGERLVENPRSRPIRPTLLPLLQEAVECATTIDDDHRSQIEQRIATYAVFGPRETALLFEDRDAQFAYALNAFITLALIALSNARDCARESERIAALDIRGVIDGRSQGLIELDNAIAPFARDENGVPDLRVFAAVHGALLKPDIDQPFTMEALEERLNNRAHEMMKDRSLVSIDREHRCVVLPSPASSFVASYDELFAVAPPEVHSGLERACALGYAFAFLAH